MMEFVHGSIEDGDVILFVTDIYEKYDEEDVIERLKKTESPILLVINKIDLAKPEDIEEKIEHWKSVFSPTEILTLSALQGEGVPALMDRILHYLPVHPPYFPKDELTDKPERFFAAEIIREKIFLNYKKEVPYSCEVVVTAFKESDDIIRISSEIYVERSTQRAILLGHKGEPRNGELLREKGIFGTIYQSRTRLETAESETARVRLLKTWILPATTY